MEHKISPINIQYIKQKNKYRKVRLYRCCKISSQNKYQYIYKGKKILLQHRIKIDKIGDVIPLKTWINSTYYAPTKTLLKIEVLPYVYAVHTYICNVHIISYCCKNTHFKIGKDDSYRCVSLSRLLQELRRCVVRKTRKKKTIYIYVYNIQPIQIKYLHFIWHYLS